MIGIISITSTLVFDESKSADRVSMHKPDEAATAPFPGTYSLLAALRGAGMSQRTRRP